MDKNQVSKEVGMVIIEALENYTLAHPDACPKAMLCAITRVGLMLSMELGIPKDSLFGVMSMHYDALMEDIDEI